jgi:ribosomal protein L21E
MSKASKGYRAATRKSLKGRARAKFKPEKFLKEFKPGDKVIITPDPSVQKALPYSRFKGGTGVICSRRGSAYLVNVRTGKAEKTVITRAEHLKALKRG